MKFRELRANEIEARVATVSDKGCSILLYKNARCDMNILDEAVGEMNWQRDHKEIKGNMYAGIGIWDAFKKSGYGNGIAERNLIPKEKKARLLTASSELALTGESEENYTLHLLYG